MDIEQRARELAVAPTVAPHAVMANTLESAADEIKRLRKLLHRVVEWHEVEISPLRKAELDEIRAVLKS